MQMQSSETINANYYIVISGFSVLHLQTDNQLAIPCLYAVLLGYPIGGMGSILIPCIVPHCLTDGYVLAIAR